MHLVAELHRSFAAKNAAQDDNAEQTTQFPKLL
jgi:hypothetical protein